MFLFEREAELFLFSFLAEMEEERELGVPENVLYWKDRKPHAKSYEGGVLRFLGYTSHPVPENFAPISEEGDSLVSVDASPSKTSFVAGWADEEGLYTS